MNGDIISKIGEGIHRWRWFWWGVIAGTWLLLVLGSVYQMNKYRGKILPGIKINKIEVGNLTPDQAKEKIKEKINYFINQWPILFTANGETVKIEFNNDIINYELEKPIVTAYAVGRVDVKGLLKLLYDKNLNIPLIITLDEQWLMTTTASVAALVNIPTIPPRLEIKTGLNGGRMAVVITGQEGEELDQAVFKERMRRSAGSLLTVNSELDMVHLPVFISKDAEDDAVRRANILLASELTINLMVDQEIRQSWILRGEDLVKFVDFAKGFDRQLLTEYVAGTSESVNRLPKDAKFRFDEGAGKVQEFSPSLEGIELQIEETVEVIERALGGIVNGENVKPAEVIIKKIAPSISLTSVNTLGIKEKIGEGTSIYKGSIPGRIYNISLAAERLNGTLIKPNEEFSFNQAVGEVSAATGYKQAYIIKEGRTQLGDGGGLCQDSTTVFRAALSAGLPITVRKGHAYRVGYYEQDAKPGLDATVFAPSTDFKFINDTGAHILLQTSADSINKKLVISLYGTSDGRKSVIKDHVVWDVTPPPPDIYEDDPNLPLGTLKQVDWKAAGAKAKFTYVVERNGMIVLEKTFVSSYKPWAAVFVRGTKL